MLITERPQPHRHIEALVFDIPEVKASARMAVTTSQCCASLGITFTRIDVWTNSEAVIEHRVIVGPTIVLLSEGEEVERLVGPRSCRQIKRFFANAHLVVPRALVAVQ